MQILFGSGGTSTAASMLTASELHDTEATQAARLAWPPGTPVALTYPERNRDGSTRWRDNFGRLLARLAVDGSDVANAMLRAGHVSGYAPHGNRR